MDSYGWWQLCHSHSLTENVVSFNRFSPLNFLSTISKTWRPTNLKLAQSQKSVWYLEISNFLSFELSYYLSYYIKSKQITDFILIGSLSKRKKIVLDDQFLLISPPQFYCESSIVFEYNKWRWSWNRNLLVSFILDGSMLSLTFFFFFSHTYTHEQTRICFLSSRYYTIN